MRLRSVGFAAFAAVALVQSCQPACTPPPPGPPARPTDEVVGLVVEGTGNGHGRGLSQWGAFGWAVEYGRSFDQILAHYYGGTSLGGVAMNTPIRIRLTGADDASIIGVISTNGTAMWNGVGYSALEVLETGPNQYNVYGAWTPTCPGSDVPLMLLAGGIRGPVTLTTAVDETTAGAGDVLGVCQPDGSVIHYRGSISVLNDANGANRTVNEVGINNYFRGVIPKEVPSSWGNAGGGAGMHALYAQAVAARSFGITQGRYGYAGTCDTSSCQVYGGAARRPGPTAPLSLPGTQVCEPGNVTFECATTNAAVADTGGWVMVWPDGRIVSTEFSSSNGPRTAGGAFPAVDDPGDAVAANPNHRWTRIIDANAVEARYGLGSLRSATTERDPASPYDGIWGNRVRLQGTAGTVLVSAWDFRNAFGLPSPGYTISAVTRELSMNAGFTFIGDSVGASLTEELPALLDGMFSEPRYDSVGGRCTAAPGCSSTGLAAAQAVPAGTTLVFVELGLNDGSNFASKLDQVMQVLRAKGVRHVVWLNVQTRSGNPAYDVTNQALWDARARWPELVVVDWNTISAGNANNQDRWFTTDRIHMTATGQAELARVVRNHVLWFARV